MFVKKERKLHIYRMIRTCYIWLFLGILSHTTAQSLGTKQHEAEQKGGNTARRHFIKPSTKKVALGKRPSKASKTHSQETFLTIKKIIRTLVVGIILSVCIIGGAFMSLLDRLKSLKDIHSKLQLGKIKVEERLSKIEENERKNPGSILQGRPKEDCINDKAIIEQAIEQNDKSITQLESSWLYKLFATICKDDMS